MREPVPAGQGVRRPRPVRVGGCAVNYANLSAVVTGASSGIGRAVAVALAARGAKVGLVARREQLLEETADQIRRAGGKAEIAAADITDRPAVLAAVAGLKQKLGPVDLMFANAGLGVYSGAYDMNVPVVEQMVHVNFLGVVYAFEAVMADMIDRKRGHLVAVSSLAAFKGLPGSAGYSATKAAVNNYCESLRIELRGSGVAVTCVCPGFIDTAMTATNDRPMPMLMTAEEGGRRILTALHRRPGVFSFPWPMRALMQVAKYAPDWYVAAKVLGKKK